MITITGKGVSNGVAYGPLYFYHRASGEIVRRTDADAAVERERFETARKTAMEQLGALYQKAMDEVGEEAACLFETHQMMLDDPDYVETVEGLIADEHLNAEAAVSDTANQFAEMFANMDNAYMQARAADVKDVSSRVIGILSGAVQGGIDSRFRSFWRQMTLHHLRPCSWTSPRFWALSRQAVPETRILQFWHVPWGFRQSSVWAISSSLNLQARRFSWTVRPVRSL